MSTKVAHVISNLTVGGTQKKLQELIAGLKAPAFEHRIINLGSETAFSRALEQSGVAVENLGLKPSPALLMKIARFLKSVRRFQPDIIQGWLYPGNVAASVAGLAVPRAATVWHVANMASLMPHEPLRGRIAFHLTRPLIWQPRKIVYVGHAVEAEHNSIGFPAGKGLTIRNGFDTDAFRPLPDEERRQLRRELGIGNGEIAIGLIARYSAVKNHAGFIAAMAKLKGAGIPARGVLLGSNVDLQNPDIAAAVSQGGNPEQFLFLGERLEINRIAACLDIIASTSFSEGLSRAIAEAMSCGVPAAVTDVGDSGLLVGETGTIAADTSVEAIADSLLRLASLSASERAELGRRARERILEEYSAAAAVSRHAELYASLTNFDASSNGNRTSTLFL
jgi:glycosyltransferase involved in cell wall biosynthesis